MNLDENWLIYCFHTNLGAEFSSYFEQHFQDHNPFNEQGEAKHSLSSAMQYFLNTARNPSLKNSAAKLQQQNAEAAGNFGEVGVWAE